MSSKVECKLKDIASILIGFPARSRVPTSAEGSHFLISAANFADDSSINKQSLFAFTPDRNVDNYIIQKSDLLFQARGAEHKAFYMETAPANYLAAGSMYMLRVTGNKVLPQYLYWWINSEEGQNYLRSLAGVSAVSFISKTALGEMPVIIPAIDIQKRIAKISILWRRHQNLNRKLESHRELLINAICNRAIKGEMSE